MNKIYKVIYRTTCFFTVMVLIYTLGLALGLSNTAGDEGVYSLLLKNIVTLFAFSVVFGLSFLIFETGLPPSAKRIFHAVVLYVAFLVAAMIMANTGDDTRQQILFIFIATLLYTVIYIASLLISKGAGKLIKK
ncbi:MAG: hypothetical protein ACOX3X_01695 [Eubacteriales bacterium]|jgi:hypothetical protein